MFKQMKKKQEGFTLVELIVVIAILGVLATLLVPNIMGNVKESKKKTAISNARTIASEVSIHNAQQAPGAALITGTKLTLAQIVTVRPTFTQGEYDSMSKYAHIEVATDGNAKVVEEADTSGTNTNP